MTDRDVPAEEAIELRRNLASLRRARTWIVLVVLVVTAATVGTSLLLPRTYEGRATIVVQDSVGVFGGSDITAAQREQPGNAKQPACRGGRHHHGPPAV